MMTIDPYGGRVSTVVAEAVRDGTVEQLRRKMAAEINQTPHDRATLEGEYGRVWDTEQVSTEFTILQFASPLVIVEEKSSGRLGTLLFQHQPRFYFLFIPDHEPLHPAAAVP
jgi:hypothetical protein